MSALYAGRFNIIVAGVLSGLQKLISYVGLLHIWELLFGGTLCLCLTFLWVSATYPVHRYVYMNSPDISVLFVLS